jgi:hypothetical protein
MNLIKECFVVIDKLDFFSYNSIKKEIDSIRDSIEKIESDKSSDQVYAFQQRVIGELEFYRLPKTEHIIKQKVLQMISYHESVFQLFDRMFNHMSTIKEPKLSFERIWINAQRKGEFIPLHQHSGIYSFVLWFEIPYHIKDESQKSPNKILIKDRSGKFEFVYIDPLGKLTNYMLDVDKSWEGVIAVFPADLHHQVYPFYTSDDLRITISGNIKLTQDKFD